MGGYAIKESPQQMQQNQSGQMGQMDQFNQGGALQFPSDIETNDHPLESINVDTPIGNIKVDTGNINVDIAVLAIGALLVFMFIYGKFFYSRDSRKEKADAS